MRYLTSAALAALLVAAPAIASAQAQPTPAQIRAAAEALQAAGAEIAAIVLAVDRGGGAHLREAGYEVRAVVTPVVD